MSLADKKSHLDEKTTSIREITSLNSERRERCNAIQEEVTDLASQKKDLEAKIQRINARSEKLVEAFQETNRMIEVAELRISDLQEEVNALQDVPITTPEDTEALATVRQNMEVARDELKNFKWKL